MNYRKRLSYAKELIRTGLLLLQSSTTYKGMVKCRPYIPYVLMPRTIKGNDYYLPLNRDYKPIGLESWESWVEYDDYEFLHIPVSEINRKEMLDESNEIVSHIARKFRRYKAGELKNDSWGYFFDDGTTPWHGGSIKKSYLELVRNSLVIKD